MVRHGMRCPFCVCGTLRVRGLIPGAGRLRRTIVAAVIVIIIVVISAVADTAQQEACQQQQNHHNSRADNRGGRGSHLAHQRQRHGHGNGVGGRLRRNVGIHDLHGGDDALIFGHAVNVHGIGLGGNTVLRRAGNAHYVIPLVGQAHGGLGYLQCLFILCHAGEGGRLGLIGHISHIIRYRSGKAGTQHTHIQRQRLERGVGTGFIVGILLAGHGDGVVLLCTRSRGARHRYGVGTHHQRIAADGYLGRAVRRLIAEVQRLHGIGHRGGIVGGGAAERRTERCIGAAQGAEVAVAAQRGIHLTAPGRGAAVALGGAVRHGNIIEFSAQGRAAVQSALDAERDGYHPCAGVDGVGDTVQQETGAVDIHGPAADELVVALILQHLAVVFQRSGYAHDVAAGDAERQRHGAAGLHGTVAGQ